MAVSDLKMIRTVHLIRNPTAIDQFTTSSHPKGGQQHVKKLTLGIDGVTIDFEADFPGEQSIIVPMAGVSFMVPSFGGQKPQVK